MKPTLSYCARESGKSKKTGLFPVCVSVRFNETTAMYNTGIELETRKEYDDSQKKNPKDQDLILCQQIKTAHERMEAIANLLEPYIPKVFAYITKAARKSKDDIFIDVNFGFNALEIASKHLAVYARENPAAPIPELKGYNKPVPIPVSNAMTIINTDGSKVPMSSQPAQQGLVPVSNNMMVTETGGNVAVLFQQFNQVDQPRYNERGILIPHTPYRIDGDFIKWMMDTIDVNATRGSRAGYTNAKSILLRFFEFEAGKGEKEEEDETFNFIKGTEYIPFYAIRPKLLLRMEKWMQKHGKTNGSSTIMKIATVKSYMGYIKAAFTKAVDEYIIPKQVHPFFGKKGYRYELPIPPKRNISLTQEELVTLFSYTPEPRKNPGQGRKTNAGRDGRIFSEEKALDFWKISCIANGMNFKDLAILKWEQVEDDTFRFIRSKTKKKVRDFDPIIVQILDPLRELMDKWGTKDRSPENYVFPIVTPPVPPMPVEQMSKTEREAWLRKEEELINDQVNGFTKYVTLYLRRIVTKLGFNPDKFTTYSARHTFVTIARLAGMAPDQIMKKLGQKSFEAYQYYNNMLIPEVEAKVRNMINSQFSGILEKMAA